MKILTILILLTAVIFGDDNRDKTLLFYCGITMVKPIKEISEIFENREGVKIKIVQGGSQDLYDSIKMSRVGDLYLPGSESYRLKNLKDGLIGRGAYIGYNQASLFVRKGNSLSAKELDDLASQKFGTIICNPNSGSIGRETKNILLKYGGEKFYYSVYDNAMEFGTDSRNLNRALRDGYADLTINWRATAFWKENRDYIDIVEIDNQYAEKRDLILNGLTTTKYPEIVDRFFEFILSEEGQNILKKYGFQNE